MFVWYVLAGEGYASGFIMLCPTCMRQTYWHSSDSCLMIPPATWDCT